MNRNKVHYFTGYGTSFRGIALCGRKKCDKQGKVARPQMRLTPCEEMITCKVCLRLYNEMEHTNGTQGN